jgi:hypothetical protein
MHVVHVLLISGSRRRERVSLCARYSEAWARAVRQRTHPQSRRSRRRRRPTWRRRRATQWRRRLSVVAGEEKHAHPQLFCLLLRPPRAPHDAPAETSWPVLTERTASERHRARLRIGSRGGTELGAAFTRQLPGRTTHSKMGERLRLASSALFPSRAQSETDAVNRRRKRHAVERLVVQPPCARVRQEL